MKKNVFLTSLKSMSLGLLMLLVLRADTCNHNCKSSISVTPKRTQTTTEFTIHGSGFPANTQITLTVSNQPSPLTSNAVSLGLIVKTDASGQFTTYWSAGYMPGTDDQTRKPYFTASDGNGCFSTQEVLSAYWFV